MSFKYMIAAAALVFGFNAFAGQEAPQEKEVQIGISGAYIPAGFDSNSDAFVVVNGVFQNGCYKWKRADVIRKGEFSHEINSIASVSQGMCIMVLVPFQKEVHLGKFSTGKHTLRFNNGDGTYLEKTMIVE